MKALILNSGLGTRMGDIKTCKCLVEIAEGQTVVDMQVQRLYNCNIKNICMTTGPYADRLESYLLEKYPEVNFQFVNNPRYDETNYIYSIFLAQEYLQEDILMFHGDLVFETNLLQDIITSTSSVMAIDSTKPLPEKDFKAVLDNKKITSVGVEFFANAVYAQPLYKLLWEDWQVWLDKIIDFCKNGNVGVYAENALNNVSDKLNLRPLDALGRLCFEIDNQDDLSYAKGVYAQCK